MLFISWLFVMGLALFITSQTHILSMLIALEFVSLAIYLLMNTACPQALSESYFSLFYLAVAVCEGALALSIVVVFTRAKENELLSALKTSLW